MKRWACFQNKLRFHLVSLKRSEEKRVGNQRLSHTIPGFVESLQQRSLPKCKRYICPKSWCVKSERGQIRASRCLFSVSEGRMARVLNHMTFWNSCRDLMMLSSWEESGGREEMVRAAGGSCLGAQDSSKSHEWAPVLREICGSLTNKAQEAKI